MHDEDEEDAAIAAWIENPTLPAPTGRALARYVYRGEGDYPDEELADIAIALDARLRDMTAARDNACREAREGFSSGWDGLDQRDAVRRIEFLERIGKS